MKLVFNRVEKRFQYVNKKVVRLALYENEEIVEALYATNNHPIYIQDKGFIAVKEMETMGGELTLLLLNENKAFITLRVRNQDKSKKEKVYDLSVINTHTYFVGKTGVWVHNSNHVSGEVTELGKHTEINASNYSDLPDGVVGKMMTYLPPEEKLAYANVHQIGYYHFDKQHPKLFISNEQIMQLYNNYPMRWARRASDRRGKPFAVGLWGAGHYYWKDFFITGRRVEGGMMVRFREASFTQENVDDFMLELNTMAKLNSLPNF